MTNSSSRACVAGSATGARGHASAGAAGTRDPARCSAIPGARAPGKSIPWRRLQLHRHGVASFFAPVLLHCGSWFVSSYIQEKLSAVSSSFALLLLHYDR